MGTCTSVPDDGGNGTAIGGDVNNAAAAGGLLASSEQTTTTHKPCIFGCGTSHKYMPADDKGSTYHKVPEQPSLTFAKTVTKELKSKGAHKRANSLDVEVYVRNLFESARSKSSKKKIEAHTRMAKNTATLPSAKAVQRLQSGVISTTALQDAALSGQVEAVARLLRSGSYNVNERYANSDTPLHVAAAAGHALMVKELLHHGADQLATDRDGWTAMHQAALQGNVEVVCALLEWSELKDGLYLRDQLDATDQEGMTPLHAAVHMRNYTATRAEVESLVSVVETLATRGADINFPDSNGWTPLHVAVQCGHVALVTALMEHGADVLREDSAGKLPVDYACNSKGTQFRSREIARILAEAAAKRTPAERPSTPCGSQPGTPRGSTPTTPTILSPRTSAATPNSPLLWDTGNLPLSPRHVAIAAAIVPFGASPNDTSTKDNFETPRAAPKPIVPPPPPTKPSHVSLCRDSPKPTKKSAAAAAATAANVTPKKTPKIMRKAATPKMIPSKSTTRRRTQEGDGQEEFDEEARKHTDTPATPSRAPLQSSHLPAHTAPTTVSTSVQASPKTSPSMEPLAEPRTRRPNEDDLILPYTGTSPSPSPRLLRKVTGQPEAREIVRKSPAVLRRKQHSRGSEPTAGETPPTHDQVPTVAVPSSKPRKLKRTLSEERLESHTSATANSPPMPPMHKSESATALSSLDLPASAANDAGESKVRYTTNGVPYVYAVDEPDKRIQRRSMTPQEAPAMFNYHNPTFRKTEDELPTPSSTPRKTS